jgi:hypothetical protein
VRYQLVCHAPLELQKKLAIPALLGLAKMKRKARPGLLDDFTKQYYVTRSEHADER